MDRFYKFYERDLEPYYLSSTSDGVIKKWTTANGAYFLKASTDKYQLEAIVECVVSDLLDLLKVAHLKYFLGEFEDRSGNCITVAISENYKQDSQIESIISAHSYLLAKGVDPNKRQGRYEVIIAGFPQSVDNVNTMIIVDYLIANHDRHLRNFEFWKKGEEIEMVPLYDHGSSLLVDWSEEDLQDLLDIEDLWEETIIYGETPSKCFSLQHSTELALVKTLPRGVFLDITSEQLSDIVDKYQQFLTPTRAKVIKNLIMTRLNNIRKRFK